MFAFKKAAAVAVGTFNMYIIQPNWLVQVGLFKEGVRVQMQADFTKPGFRFRADETAYWWNVRPDRLVLETESSDFDCGEPLSVVLDTLRWTPLTGVGTNLEFEADIEIIDKLQCSLPACKEFDGFQSGQRTWHSAFIKKEQSYNLQVAIVPPGIARERESGLVSLSINVHTEVSKEKKQVESNKLAIAACKQFGEHRHQAIQIAREMLGVEVNI